jgi:1,4-alpha-glucan branching enzyme
MSATPDLHPAQNRGLRELLALQASDWAFMRSREIASPYAAERFAGHLRELHGALTEGPEAEQSELGNLATDADRAWLLAP